MIIHFFLRIIANVRISLNFDTVVIQRDGKHYLEIKDVRPQLKIGQFSAKSSCKNMAPIINHFMDSAVNFHQKLYLSELEPSLEKNIGEMIKLIISSIFDKIPVQAFYQHRNSVTEV